MKWDLAENVRADILTFTGLNFSGVRSVTRVTPNGVFGDPIEGDRLKSFGIIAPLGMRITLITSSADDWEQETWRAFEIRAENTFTSKEGKPAVQVADPDLLTPWTAIRVDPDLVEDYFRCNTLSEGKGHWTYGRAGSRPLKCNVVKIKVDRF